MTNTDLSKAVLWCQCSASASDAVNRASYGLWKGWKFFVDFHIRPVVDWFHAEYGQPMRVLLHLPFGRTVDNVQRLMAFNEYQQAIADGHFYFVDDFEQQIGDLVQSGHEVICYFGAPHNTVQMQSDLANGRRVELIRCMLDTLKLPLAAGCSVAFDNMTSLGRSEHSEALYWYVKSLGTRCYVEATPEKHIRNVAFWNEPSIIRWPLFANRHSVHRHSGALGRFPKVGDPDFYPEEVMVLMTQQEMGFLDEVVGYGCAPALTIGGWKREIL